MREWRTEGNFFCPLPLTCTHACEREWKRGEDKRIFFYPLPLTCTYTCKRVREIGSWERGHDGRLSFCPLPIACACTCAQESKGVGREGRIENFSSILFPLCMHLCAHKTLKVEESKDARCKVEEKAEVKVEEELEKT